VAAGGTKIARDKTTPKREDSQSPDVGVIRWGRPLEPVILNLGGGGGICKGGGWVEGRLRGGLANWPGPNKTPLKIKKAECRETDGRGVVWRKGEMTSKQKRTPLEGQPWKSRPAIERDQAKNGLDNVGQEKWAENEWDGGRSRWGRGDSGGGQLAEEVDVVW